MTLHVFGIRHHGPGCARSLRAALDELEPDVVVLEGPADAESVLGLAANPGLEPPVAMLVYPVDQPSRACYYPMTVFSPEWQALRWATDRKVPVRLMDLPQSIRMAIDLQAEEEAKNAAAPDAISPSVETPPPIPNLQSPTPPPPIPARPWRADPIALLAEAAGYRDHELWWESQIERRVDATGLFAAILEAMTAVRGDVPDTDPQDLLREAHMRQTLRAIAKENHQRIAVVCGAWHAPVLQQDALEGKLGGKLPACKVKDDAALLKGLPKVKTAVTWIPWTHQRLTYRSGYGAGVHSPGWYAHVWKSHDEAPLRWIATAARLLREADLDASPASIIETIRLADCLAAMRNLRSPGLAELSESMLAILCHGNATPMQLIRRELEVGDVLGKVPEETPSVPLAQDVKRLQKSLRMPATTEIKPYDLDLRKENDLARSQLLHRLNLLSIEWGDLRRSNSKTSTFHEIWSVAWQPEFEVAIIEANVWGNTVEAAASAKVIDRANATNDLPPITELLDRAILAGLLPAIDPLLQRVSVVAAAAADVRHLLTALMPLARVVRYSDVRQTKADRVLPVLMGLFERAVVGLPAACASLDDDAAQQMLDAVAQAQQAIALLAIDDMRREWIDRLEHLAGSTIHGLVRGWCCRLLREENRIDDEQLAQRTRLALSLVNGAAASAAWLTGLLRGSGLLLLHQEGLWLAVDRWLSELNEESFTELLPLVRCAFAGFSPPERRQMGEKVKRLRIGSTTGRAKSVSATPRTINVSRAQRVLPVLAQLLGLSKPPK